MYDPGYEIQTEYMEGENDSQYGENSHLQRFMQNYQSPNGRRQKVKNNHFFSIPSHENLPVVFPKSRQCLENSHRVKNASPQSIFSQSNEKPSINIFREQEDQVSYPLVSLPSKTTLNTQGSPRLYATRIRPKNIPQEKERLYDEIINLKNSVHTLKDENLKLKTKINSLEKDSVKYERIIANQDVFIVEKDVTSKSAESHFVITLKNQLKDTKAILNSREIELAEVYKSVKYTKIHELEIQSKAFAEEAARLKGILEQVVQERTQNLMEDHDKSRLQEECFLQAGQLQTLQRNNEELNLAIKVLEQMSAEAKKKSHEKERRLKKEIEKQKQIVNEKERENLRLFNEINGIASNSSRSHPNLSPSRGFIGSREDFTTELEAKKIEVAGLLEQIAEKDTKIQSLETQVKELTILNKPTILQNGEKINYRRTNSGRRSMFEDFKSAGLKDQVDEDKIYEATLGFHHFLSHIDAESIQASPKGGISPERTTKNNRFEFRKVQKVRIEDVKEFAYEINLIFRVKNLIFEEAVKDIWPEKVQETNNVSIKEMSQILKKEPFNVRDNADAVLIARYLIENSEDEYISYNENLEMDVTSVKNSLKKFIGPIPKWDKEATRELHDSISEILNKHHGSLRENLRALCKSRYMTRRVFQDVCRLVDIFLSEEQVEYIVTKLFEQANNLHKLKIDALFEIFAQKPKETPELVKKTTRESRRSSDLSNKSSEMPDFFVRRNSRSFTTTELLPMARHFIRESELEDEEENSPVKKKNYTRIDVSDYVEEDNQKSKSPNRNENRLFLGLKRVSESDHSPVADQENEKKHPENHEEVPKKIEDLEKNNTSANEKDQTQEMKEFDPRFYSDSPVSNPRVQIFSTLEVGSDKDFGQQEKDSEYNEEADNSKDENTSQDDRASESAGSDSSRKRPGFQRPYVVTMNQYTENKSTFYKTDRMKSSSLFLEEKKDFLSDHGLQLNAISEREETFEDRSFRSKNLEDTESRDTKMDGKTEEGYSQEASARENIVKSRKESEFETEKAENLERVPEANHVNEKSP